MGGCGAGRGEGSGGGGGSHVGDAEGDGGVVIEEVVHGAHGHVVARRRLLDGPVPHVSIAALQYRRACWMALPPISASQRYSCGAACWMAMRRTASPPALARDGPVGQPRCAAPQPGGPRGGGGGGCCRALRSSTEFFKSTLR